MREGNGNSNTSQKRRKPRGGYRGNRSNNGYPKRSGSHGGRSRSHRGGGGRKRFQGENIPHHKYVSKAESDYVAPSIYMDDKFYQDYDISDALKRNIQYKGYKNPTKIQDEAIPVIFKGNDVLGMASTGSGKTGAFLIPMIEKVIDDRSQRCLIIVPTRELAQQIEEEFNGLAHKTGIYSTLTIGGTNIRSQIRKLKQNPHFVMGTPGRLKDLYERKAIDLGRFNNIILDEVDRMLDMGFIPDITFLISKLRQERQTLFFSATMTPEAEKIAHSLLKDPVKIQVEKESPLKSVDQDIVKCHGGGGKMPKLIEILKQEEVNKTLIFARTKRGADRISKDLQQASFKVDSIHGGKSQNKRQYVLTKFKRNNINILVATDVAARGLDIPNVTHVINYDEPATYKDYIHRIGRTARAGKTGTAYTFVTT